MMASQLSSLISAEPVPYYPILSQINANTLAGSLIYATACLDAYDAYGESMLLTKATNLWEAAYKKQVTAADAALGTHNGSTMPCKGSTCSMLLLKVAYMTDIIATSDTLVGAMIEEVSLDHGQHNGY
jgi:hypothetical protein